MKIIKMYASAQSELRIGGGWLMRSFVVGRQAGSGIMSTGMLSWWP